MSKAYVFTVCILIAIIIILIRNMGKLNHQMESNSLAYTTCKDERVDLQQSISDLESSKQTCVDSANNNASALNAALETINHNDAAVKLTMMRILRGIYKLAKSRKIYLRINESSVDVMRIIYDGESYSAQVLYSMNNLMIQCEPTYTNQHLKLFYRMKVSDTESLRLDEYGEESLFENGAQIMAYFLPLIGTLYLMRQLDDGKVLKMHILKDNELSRKDKSSVEEYID